MSLSSGHGPPKTPERKTSGSILSAWRSLTGSRSKINLSSSPATTLTPVQAIFVPSDPSKNVEQGATALGTVASGAPIDRQSSSYNSYGADEDLARVTGGPNELPELLCQLRPERPMPERVKAAQSVSDIIKRYPISNTLTVWSIARDLLDGRDSDASNAAFTLLLGCVASDALSPVERKVFFDSISGSHNTVRLESRFEALVALTKGGRNVEALESDLPESLASLLEACFHAVSKARKREKKLRTDAIAQEEKLFADLFQYISDVAKYNSKIFSDDELELMFARIISICKTTNSQTDISGSLELIDALITYTHVPVNGIPPCVQLLCDIYKQIESLRKPVWTTLKDLFGSHLASPTIFALLDTMHGTQDGRTTHPSARGAFLILTKVIRRGHKPKIPSVPWDLFVQACKGSLAIDNPEYFAEMIKFYSDALSSDDLSQQLLEDADWPELIALILQCGSISRIFAGSTDTATTDQSSFLLVPIQNSMPDESERDALADALIIFAQKLNLLFHRMDFVPKASAIDFFLHLEPLVSTSTIQTILNHYESERLLWLSSPGWLEACRFFIDRLLKDRSRPSAMRVRMIKMLREVYDTASNVPGDSDIEVLPSLILDCIPLEDDPVVLDELGDFATDITRLASEELFQRVLDVVKSTILKPADVTVPDRVSVPLTSPEILGSTENVLTRALVRMFTRNVDLATWKTQCLYDTLLDIAGQENCQSDARIGALRLLSRLRSDAHCAIYVNGPSESEEIAAIFSTTAKTVMSEIIEGEIIQTSRLRSDRASPGPEQRKVSGELSHPPLSRNKSMRADIPASPLWLAGPRGLPEEPCGQSSRVLFSSLTLDKGTNQEETQVLKIDKWLDLVISILNRDGANGEIYTYTLVHLGAQLANGTIFAAAAPQIQALRCLLCEQIKTLSSRDPHRSAPFRKADVAVCMYHILTMLISYHDNFSKAEEDDIVRTFLLGIGTWESASNWCIHALALACHELSASVSKSLETILQKMSQIITQSRVQMHVLEFLAGLSRLPELYKNFREDDYRMVFGICFRFLQSSRDDRDKRKTASPPPFKPGQGALRHSAGSRDLNALSESNAKGFPTSATSSDLPQYVYALAHHVISFWFFCLKLDDRAKYVPWITKNLTYTEGAATAEREVIEEQGLVTIDMMQRTAHTDRDETTRREDFAKPSDGEVSKKSWIVGSSILTIETAGRTGVSQITTRRPSSTRYVVLQPHLSLPPRHQIPLTTGLDADTFYTSSYIGVLPDDIFQEFYSPYAICALPIVLSENPIPLLDDDTTRRAISTFDRNTTVDSHKVGVIYIGDGQSSESEILSNVMGSPDYTSFITSLGTLIRLKGANFNTQGLDREFDTDGEFAIAWRDRVTELVFHITTMMPTNLDQDPTGTAKKKHTGNDFVNIVWNNSGLPFKFDTFPSAFNFVYIVITPTARASFLDTRTKVTADDTASVDVKSTISSNAPTMSDEGPANSASQRTGTRTLHNYFYRVEVLSAPGFPDISPASNAKIISGKALPDFIRFVALNASVFSFVWANREGGDHVSSWRNRLREIKRLREKYLAKAQSQSSPEPRSRPPSTPLSGGERNSVIGAMSGLIGMGGDRRPTPSMRDSGIAAAKRTSAMTVMSEDNTSRSSLLSSAGPDERRGSQ